MSSQELLPLELYQARVVGGAGTAMIKHNKDVLIEAATGAGKTPILARLARLLVKNGGKVLILTHRRPLFQQMVGNPLAKEEKAQAGEIHWWARMQPGTICEAAMGGINQDPGIVVAMVDTAAARLDLLANYTDVLVDEVHHFSASSAEGEDLADLGSYAKILTALETARLAGTSATTFRGDEDLLHPRLEKAHREVVSVEEALSSKRIVPIRTVLGKAPLASGRRVVDLVDMQFQGKLGKRTASAVMENEMGASFYEKVADDWDTVAKRKKTILFVKGVKEIRLMERLLGERYGPESVVSLHGGKSLKENNLASLAYESGPADILVACQMIGEGFNVPATDVVMNANPSLSRGQQNQYPGRASRAAEGKTEALFVDYGTASLVHGFVEHQHQLQNIDALAASGSLVGSGRAVARMAPVRDGAWQVACGEKNSYFVQTIEGKHAVFVLNHRAEKEEGRRAGKKNSSVRGMRRYEHEELGTRMMTTSQLASFFAKHAREEADWLARMGGVGSDTYIEACSKALEASASNRKIYEIGAQKKRDDPARKVRADALAEILENPEKSRHKAKMLSRALATGKRGSDTVREGLLLISALLEHCERREDVPIGVRAEVRGVTESLRVDDVLQFKTSELRSEGQAALATMTHLGEKIVNPDLQELLTDVSEPISAGLMRMKKEKAKSGGSSETKR